MLQSGEDDKLSIADLTKIERINIITWCDHGAGAFSVPIRTIVKWTM